MTRCILTTIALLTIISVTGQNPVSWTYAAKKIADKTYEVHITAKIQNGWHLYSQNQPADAIAIPIAIKINTHPLAKVSGKAKEIGDLEKHKEPSLGIEDWQYSEKVEFVQTVSLKANVKTNISGTIEYQACTNEKCLPPKTMVFNVRLE